MFTSVWKWTFKIELQLFNLKFLKQRWNSLMIKTFKSRRSFSLIKAQTWWIQRWLTLLFILLSIFPHLSLRHSLLHWSSLICSLSFYLASHLFLRLFLFSFSQIFSLLLFFCSSFLKSSLSSFLLSALFFLSFFFSVSWFLKNIRNRVREKLWTNVNPVSEREPQSELLKHQRGSVCDWLRPVIQWWMQWGYRGRRRSDLIGRWQSEVLQEKIPVELQWIRVSSSVW